MAPRKTEPASPASRNKSHVTPRRIVSMHDDLWLPLQDLAAHRHMNASALLRELVRDAVAEARVNGELPKAKRRAA